ncbi:MAG: hypothetical protein Fur0041_11610 [Bacteroidia bacterium]
MTSTQRKVLLWSAFAIGIVLLFLPVRNDVVTGYYSSDDPATRTLIPAQETHVSSVLIGFNGHPAGIAGLIFFALMPFFVIAQSFSVKKPFTLPARALIQLQALLMFIGGAYVYYIITYQHGYFSNAEHTTEPAWGGWIFVVYEIFFGVILFWILADPESKPGRLFENRSGKN